MLNAPYVDINGSELAALLHALRYSLPPLVAVTDSSFVVKGLSEHGRERTTHHGYAWADLWKQAWRLLDDFGGLGPGGLTIVKVRLTSASEGCWMAMGLLAEIGMATT